jgi:predicted 2-oxoglutarate/Fe(II)-dependent dioxygenase YbiX/peroxiredoxin
MLLPGDPIPSFNARSFSNPRYFFDSAAGRHIVLSFIGSGGLEAIQPFLRALYGEATPFDDAFASIFLVTTDARDLDSGILQERYPGIRILLDDSGQLAAMFGCLRTEEQGKVALSLTSYLIDPGLRIAQIIPIEQPGTHLDQLRAALAPLPNPAIDTSGWAPVLLVPNVLEPELCRAFLAHGTAQGYEDSGFMTTDPSTGQTIKKIEYGHKKREDCEIADEGLRNALQARVHRRIIPQIARAFQFHATRMERYIIARYGAETSGHFRPHKDNTTAGTAHRRFAVSINLNADDYDGGDLRFPEFGMRTYRAPTGGAIVFSCSLLHEATAVTRGERFVILPFLYDEAAAKVRLENAMKLADPELRNATVASVMSKPPEGYDAGSGKGAKSGSTKPRRADTEKSTSRDQKRKGQSRAPSGASSKPLTKTSKSRVLEPAE